jgi:hypothetical protein
MESSITIANASDPIHDWLEPGGDSVPLALQTAARVVAAATRVGVPPGGKALNVL